MATTEGKLIRQWMQCHNLFLVVTSISQRFHATLDPQHLTLNGLSPTTVTMWNCQTQPRSHSSGKTLLGLRIEVRHHTCTKWQLCASRWDIDEQAVRNLPLNVHFLAYSWTCVSNRFQHAARLPRKVYAMINSKHMGKFVNKAFARPLNEQGLLFNSVTGSLSMAW